MKGRLFVLIIASLAFMLAVHPQGTAKSDKTAVVRASDKPVIVKANVLVLDSNRKVVEDVKAADIKLYEDGVEQKIETLEKKSPGLTLVIAVDNSNSLRYLLERVIQSAKLIASELQPNDEVLAIRFVSSDKIETLEEFTNDKQKLQEAFDSMFTEGGGSSIIDAVYLSIQRLMKREKSDGTRRQAVIVISDFDDRDSFYKLKDLSDLTSKSDAQIFPLKFPGAGLTEKANATIERLAHQLALNTGGTAHIMGPKAVEADLVAKLGQIMNELRAPYVVRYRSTNPNRDGLPRTLRVEVVDGPNGEKRRGISRTGFVVPKD